MSLFSDYASPPPPEDPEWLVYWRRYGGAQDKWKAFFRYIYANPWLEDMFSAKIIEQRNAGKPRGYAQTALDELRDTEAWRIVDTDDIHTEELNGTRKKVRAANDYSPYLSRRWRENHSDIADFLHIKKLTAKDKRPLKVE